MTSVGPEFVGIEATIVIICCLAALIVVFIKSSKIGVRMLTIDICVPIIVGIIGTGIIKAPTLDAFLMAAGITLLGAIVIEYFVLKYLLKPSNTL